MKKILILFIGLLVVFCGVVFILHDFCHGYSCLSFDNKQGFKETERVENTDTSYRGTLTKGDIRVRIEAYSAPSQEVAKRFTQAKVMQLQGLFEVARSPYPGVLSNEIECENRLKPIVKDTVLSSEIKATVVTGYLNERLQYGSCVDNQITHIGKIAMFYCDNQKKWYYFETIFKKSDTNLDAETTHLIQSLKCQRPF